MHNHIHLVFVLLVDGFEYAIGIYILFCLIVDYARKDTKKNGKDKGFIYYFYFFRINICIIEKKAVFLQPLRHVVALGL